MRQRVLVTEPIAASDLELLREAYDLHLAIGASPRSLGGGPAPRGSRAGRRVVAGSVLRGRPHAVRVGDYWFDFVADGPLLVSEHIERPGTIGQMGTILGEAGIDIAFLQVGRQRRGGRGMMVLGIDRPPGEHTMARVMAMPSVRSARVLSL